MSSFKRGTADDARKVWTAWVKRQKMPEACRFTSEREDLVRKRIGLGYTADDLLAVVRWAYESEERGPRWLRGENDDRTTYLDLESLFRISKLGARVQAALVWIRERESPANASVPDHPSGLRLVRGGRSVRR